MTSYFKILAVHENRALVPEHHVSHAMIPGPILFGTSNAVTESPWIGQDLPTGGSANLEVSVSQPYRPDTSDLGLILATFKNLGYVSLVGM